MEAIDPQKRFGLQGFENAISSVLRRILLVNKNEQKYRNYLGVFFLPVSGVIGKVQRYRKKGKTVMPSRSLQAKGETCTLQSGETL